MLSCESSYFNSSFRFVSAYADASARVRLQGVVTLASCSKLEPFVKLGQRSVSHRVGIEAALVHGLRNARVGAANTTKLRLLCRLADGFHSAAPSPTGQGRFLSQLPPVPG